MKCFMDGIGTMLMITIFLMTISLGLGRHHFKKDRDFWKESAQYQRKKVVELKFRINLLEDAFGIGTKKGPGI